MSNQTLGIDHPVVTVRDHAAALRQYRAIGFSPSPVSYHPWGTVLSLLMFRDNFIELIGVHDPALFGTNAVNGFCYGRNVGLFLERAEGLGLVALHSTDSDEDHARLVARGLSSQGRIDFRRAMRKADGTPDTAVVSLGLFLNERHRDVSHFICHQHRPELIWVPEWQRHPNGAHSVAAVSYLARDPQDLEERFTALYGADRVKALEDGLHVDAGCGAFRVLSPGGAERSLGDLPLPWWADGAPHGIAITVATSRFDELESLWRGNGIDSQRSPSGSLLLEPRLCGNVILEFVAG
ncbi:VOC family protein [Azospirillum griseum]|uniref:VOC family protein n=1 Tax=Azospirillum griseum TaxID=2496639 RepID=A0A431VAR1_9PROT|nr:VOC family protein [Azospirillum griseum]RTR14599.1 VOC family protein [Azospirillum griseum]